MESGFRCCKQHKPFLRQLVVGEKPQEVMVPFVRISLREGTTPEYRKAIADGVQPAMTRRKPRQKRVLFKRMSELLAKSPGVSSGRSAGQPRRSKLGELVIREWRSAVPDGLKFWLFKGGIEPPLCRLGGNEVVSDISRTQIWPMPPSTLISTPVI
jgi:hypothetical protein